MDYVCAVCGYVHEGEEPPDICAYCDAPQPAFLIFHADEQERDVGAGAALLNQWTAEALEFTPDGLNMPSA